MDSLGGFDYAGITALVAAIGHIIYTMYRHWKQVQIAEIEEGSETIVAQAGYLESIAKSAATMIECSEKRLSYLSEQMGELQIDYTILRKTLSETQDIVQVLKADNRRLSEKVQELERENHNLKERLGTLERTNGTAKPN